MSRWGCAMVSFAGLSRPKELLGEMRLEQVYTRLDERTYRYEARVDGAPFVARLDVDALGRVVVYEGLWVAEEAP